MREEVKELIVRAQSGDRAAMNTLVEENRGLILSAVNRFRDRGESDDLFQLGAIGLIKAVRRFDLSYGVEFSTYAVPMIVGEIKRFLRDDGAIKVSRNLKELARRACRLMEKDGEMTVSELAAQLEVTPAQVTEALEAVRRPDSIDRSISDGDGRPISLMDTIPGEDREDELLTRISLRQAIMDLPGRDRVIIVMRYFRGRTQTEVARVLGLSQVQISRLEKKILEEMREKIG